jgi:hypothetical protein
MIVERCALAVVPDHDDRAVAAARITVEQTSRVAVGRGDEEGRVEELLAALHDVLEHALDVATDRLRIVSVHGLVEAPQQLVHLG